MEQLVIVDSCAPVDVHIYNIDTDTIVDEAYIESLGYNTDYCQWALGDNINITFHTEILK